MQPGKQKYSLHKLERLCNKPEISKLFSQGQRVNCSPVSVISQIESSKEQKVQAVFVASKRIFKNANDRNRVKRLLREAYRKNKPYQLLQDIPGPAKIKLAISLNKLDGVSLSQIEDAMVTCFSNLPTNA